MSLLESGEKQKIEQTKAIRCHSECYATLGVSYIRDHKRRQVHFCYRDRKVSAGPVCIASPEDQVPAQTSNVFFSTDRLWVTCDIQYSKCQGRAQAGQLPTRALWIFEEGEREKQRVHRASYYVFLVLLCFCVFSSSSSFYIFFLYVFLSPPPPPPPLPLQSSFLSQYDSWCTVETHQAGLECFL